MKKGKRLNKTIIHAIILLTVTALLISPLIHELLHMVALEIYGCKYIPNIDISSFRVHGKLTPMCVLGNIELFIVYMIGVAGTLLISTVLMCYDKILIRRRMIKASILISAVSLGFLASSVSYFFEPEGDIINALSVIGIETHNFIPLIGLMICVLYSWIFWSGIVLIEKEVIERAFRSAENSISGLDSSGPMQKRPKAIDVHELAKKKAKLKSRLKR